MTTKKKVLIIDDSRTVRQQIALTLISAGYQVVEAGDGKEGLAALVEHADVSVVLCDLNMPCMNGFEFLKSFKSGGAHPGVSVVMLTTDGSPDLVAQAKRAGAKGWIVKPFQPELLLAAVRRLSGEPE